MSPKELVEQENGSEHVLCREVKRENDARVALTVLLKG